jgi:phosphoribosylformylglycinamidine synthase
MGFYLTDIESLKKLSWFSQREWEILKFFMENESSTLKSIFLAEYLRYLKFRALDAQIYNNIEHSGSFYYTHAEVTTLQIANASQAAWQLFVDLLLGSVTKGYNPFAIFGYLNVPDLKKKNSLELIKNVTDGLSDASPILGIPLTDMELGFSNKPEEESFLTLEVMAERLTSYDSTATNIGRSNAMIFLAGSPFIRGELSKGWLSFNNKNSINTNYKLNKKFSQKLLLECTKELVEIEGINCYYPLPNLAASLIHLARNSNMYLSIDIGNLLADSPGSNAEEILLSDTSGRMIIFCSTEKSDIVLEKFKKWEISYEPIGKIGDNDTIQICDKEKILIEVNSKWLKSITNRYSAIESYKTSGEIYKPVKSRFKLSEKFHPRDIGMKLISLPQIASKKWLIDQFESSLLNNNYNLNNETDARIVFSLSGNEPIAYAMAIPQIYSSTDIYDVVIECIMQLSQRLICSGAEVDRMNVSIAIPDYQFDTESLKPISKACKHAVVALQLKQFSAHCIGIESICSSSFRYFVPALPVITMSGAIKKNKKITGMVFQNKGDMIYLLGYNKVQFSGQFTKLINNAITISRYKPDVEFEILMQNTLKELISQQLINSAQLLSAGGLFSALVKATVPFKFGFDITTDAEVPTDLFLFGEAPSRVLVSVSPKKEDKFIDFIVDKQFSFTVLGHVTKEEFRVDDISYGFISDISKIYLKSFSENFK